MTNRPGRIFGSALIIAIMLSLVAGVWSTRNTTQASRARDWATVHASTMPKTLDGFAAFPAAYRLAAFRQLSPADRSMLWREQLQRVATDATLTPAQARFVTEFRSALSPDLYREYQPGQEPAALVAARDLCASVSSLGFSEVQKRALRELGYEGTTLRAQSFQSLTINVLEALHDAVTLRATSRSSTYEICDCVHPSFCDSGCSTNTGCMNFPFGCGCGGIWICNGQRTPLIEN